jgi:hypothetical protein
VILLDLGGAELEAEDVHRDVDLVVRGAQLSVVRPEVRLLIAVLDQALVDLHDRDPAVREDAERWFYSESDPRNGGVSLELVADELGVGVRDLRRLACAGLFGLNPQRATTRRSWAKRRVHREERRDEDARPIAA